MEKLKYTFDNAIYMASWRDHVEPSLKGHLEAQIRNSSRHKAFLRAPNQANAQLWIAIANLSKKLYDLQMKLEIVDTALKESLNVVREAEEKKMELPSSQILQIRSEPKKTAKRKTIKKKAKKKAIKRRK
jgi:hypothetical protein